MTTKIASTKQTNFIAALIAERQVTNHVPDVDAFMAALAEQRLTTKGASQLIDTLLSQPKDPDPVAEAERIARQAAGAPAPAASIRTNRYGGKCLTCGMQVAANEGRLDKLNGRWVTYHLDGQCPANPADLQAELNTILTGFEDGFYAVPFVGQGSHTDLTFFGIRTRNNGSGDRYVVHTVGGHADTDDVTNEWVERALHSLTTVDRYEAMQAYGQKMGYCGDCGRHLTDEISRKLGIGPVCAAK